MDTICQSCQRHSSPSSSWQGFEKTSISCQKPNISRRDNAPIHQAKRLSHRNARECYSPTQAPLMSDLWSLAKQLQWGKQQSTSPRDQLTLIGCLIFSLRYHQVTSTSRRTTSSRKKYSMRKNWSSQDLFWTSKCHLRVNRCCTQPSDGFFDSLPIAKNINRKHKINLVGRTKVDREKEKLQKM